MLGRVRRRWFSRKALLLHLALVIVVSGCLIAGWWQVSRARSGNLLSYGYAVEWPVFAGFAVAFWWQLMRDRTTDGHPRTRPPRPAPPPPGASDQPVRRREEESPALRAYNDNLVALSARARPKTWRNPKGLS